MGKGEEAEKDKGDEGTKTYRGIVNMAESKVTSRTLCASHATNQSNLMCFLYASE
jgi:hypothetical protein